MNWQLFKKWMKEREEIAEWRYTGASGALGDSTTHDISDIERASYNKGVIDAMSGAISMFDQVERETKMRIYSLLIIEEGKTDPLSDISLFLTREEAMESLLSFVKWKIDDYTELGKLDDVEIPEHENDLIEFFFEDLPGEHFSRFDWPQYEIEAHHISISELEKPKSEELISEAAIYGLQDDHISSALAVRHNVSAEYVKSLSGLLSRQLALGVVYSSIVNKKETQEQSQPPGT